MGSARKFSVLRLIGALVVAVLGACSDSHEPGSQAPGRGVYVQAAWRTARAVSGHQVHVAAQRIACVRCHELAQGSVGKADPGRCASCHAREGRIEHATEEARQRFGAGVTADCTLCHAFTAEDSGHTAFDAGVVRTFAATDCARCHATQQGHTPPVLIHGTSQCVTCHHPHEDEKPKPAACTTCHHDVQTRHAAEGKSITQVCTTCHTHQHAPASAALTTCAECHAKQAPIVPASALFAGGHTECVGCHRPHDFDKASATPCRSCHASVNVLAAARVPAHNPCTSCHAPHAVHDNPGQACASCHKDVHADHPQAKALGPCVGCHDPHPDGQRAQDLARRCSSCHQVAATDTSFHGAVPCKGCHTPHHFVLASSKRALCQTCHAQEVTLASTLAGHRDCEGCHRGLPHHPTALKAACETCHAGIHAEANAGHKQCTNCHEPHSGARRAACASCHATEARTAPAGHRECTNCHKPHSGSTQGVACASCHASEAQSKHGQLAGACSSCHRPHGPNGIASPPACTTCHQTSTLAGLHSNPKHNDCRRCHTGHDDSALGLRAQCLTCHADRKDHFADSPRCASCHLFGKNR